MADKIASNNSFVFVGQINFKEDKFMRVFSNDSWEIYNINFSIKTGNSMHFVEAKAFKPKDPTYRINYFINNNGTFETKKIDFASRLEIDGDILSSGLHSSIDKNGEKIRFVSNYDFVKSIENYLRSGEFKGKTFRLRGMMEYDNYVKDGQVKEIERFIVQHIEEMTENIPPKSEGRYKIYLGDDCFNKFGDIGILEGKTLKTVYDKKENKTDYYGFNTKIEISLGNNPEKAYEFLSKHKYYGSNERFNKIGIICEIVNGFEEEEFTEDMLTEEEKMEIELGFSTFEQIKETKGKGIGEKVKKLKRINEMRGFSKPEETVISLKDLSEFKVIKESAPVNLDSEDTFAPFEVSDDDVPFF